MKRIEQSGPLHAAYYLIEADGEYEKAILGYLKDNHQNPEQWGMEDQFDLDALVQGHRVNGNRQSREHDYPYVLTINLDDEYYRLTVNFVPKTWFDEGVGTLQEVVSTLYNNDTMKPWIDHILAAARHGEPYIEFEDVDDAPNPDNTCAVNDRQIDFIRSKGYVVNWEKYPRSYRVSGW